MFQSHRDNLQKKAPILDCLKDPLIYAVLWQYSITKDQQHFPYEYDQCMVYLPTFPTEISTNVGKEIPFPWILWIWTVLPIRFITKDLVEQTTPVATTIEDAGLTVSEAPSDFFRGESFPVEKVGFFSERDTVNLS